MIDEDNYIKAVEVGLDYLSAFENDNNDYLEHHGVEGMKWGIENGPPYPLSGQGKKDFIAQRKAVREEKKKKKILNDPKKLAKNASKFTKEEIDEANAKFESLKKTKQLAKPELSSLTKQKHKMSKDAITLERNINKFSPEELDLALKYLDSKDKLFDKKINELDKPRKAFSVANNYLGVATSFIDNISKIGKTGLNLEDMYLKRSGKGLTLDDRYEVYKKKYSSHKDVFNKNINEQSFKEFWNNATPKQKEEYLKWFNENVK